MEQPPQINVKKLTFKNKAPLIPKFRIESDSSLAKKVELEVPQGKRILKSFPKMQGTGKIMASGRSVTGLDSKFLSEVNIGDLISLINPVKFVEETRKVNAIVSEASLGIAEPFSNSIGTFVNFQIQPEDKLVVINEEGVEVEVSQPYKATTQKRVKGEGMSKGLVEAELVKDWKKKTDRWCK